jgi:hypothetical protein
MQKREHGLDHHPTLSSDRPDAVLQGECNRCTVVRERSFSETHISIFGRYKVTYSNPKNLRHHDRGSEGCCDSGGMSPLPASSEAVSAAPGCSGEGSSSGIR